MKIQYVMCQRDLDELRVMVNEIPMPGGQNGWLEKIVKMAGAKKQAQQVRLKLTNDVERSRRVLRLLYANWLPQIDKPANERAPIAIRTPTLIYASDATAPAAARAIPPEDLDAVIGQTLLAKEFFRPPDQFVGGGAPWSGWAWEGESPLAREPRRRAVLIVKLAAELYRREHGRPPENAGAFCMAASRSCRMGSHAMKRFRQTSNECRGRESVNNASGRLAFGHDEAQPAQAVWFHRHCRAGGASDNRRHLNLAITEPGRSARRGRSV